MTQEELDQMCGGESPPSGPAPRRSELPPPRQTFRGYSGHHAEQPARDPNEIGALWTKQTKHGHDYFTGTVHGEKIVVFANTKKRSDKSPDWRILKSTPRET